MSKKKIIIILSSFAVLIVIAAGILYFFGWKNRNSGESPITSLDQLTGGGKIAGDLVYEDEAGFSFSYPKEVRVSDQTPEDDSYYTLLTLSKGEEKITISAQDTKETKTEDYIKKSKDYQIASLYGAVTLGGMSAKQYSLSDKLLTVVVDKGVVYLIEGPKDGGFWEETQSIVIDSFTFAGSESASGGSAASDVVYEEEEVVE